MKAIRSILLLVFTVSGAFFLYSACINDASSSEYKSIWVYNKSGQDHIAEEEQIAASYIIRDQLEQLKKAGKITQSTLNNDWYFIEKMPNDIFLTSYLMKSGESFFLFVYAVDLISGRIVHGDYHVSKSMEGLKGITFWPIDKLKKYNMKDHKDIYSQNARTLLIDVGPSKGDKEADFFLLVNLCACKLSDEKWLNITTKSLRDVVLRIDGVLTSCQDVVDVITPNKYSGHTMFANLIYEITPTTSSEGKAVIELVEKAQNNNVGGYLESRIEAIEIGSVSIPKRLEAIAAQICDAILKSVKQATPIPEDIGVVMDEKTGKILRVLDEGYSMGKESKQ